MILYLVTTFRHVSELRKNVRIQTCVSRGEILFVTREYLIQRALEEQGWRSKLLGADIDGDEAAAWGRRASETVINWMRDSSWRDFTEFQGVSLGRASYSLIYHRVVGTSLFQLILGIISEVKEYAVSEIIYERSRSTEQHAAMQDDEDVLKIIARHFDLDFSIVQTSDMSPEDQQILNKQISFPFANARASWFTGSPGGNLPLRHAIKTTLFKIVSYVKRVFPRARLNVLTTVYFPMNYYLPYAFQKRQDGIRYHFLDSWMRGFVLSSKHGFCQDLFGDQADVSAEERAAISNMAARLLGLAKDERYRSRFMFEGMDFSDYCIAKLHKIILGIFPLYLKQIGRFKILLQKEKFDAFFTAYEGTWYASLLIDLCRQKHIPTIEIIDGFRSTGSYVSLLCDHVLCWSEEQKTRFFVEWLKKDTGCVHPVGTPLVSLYRTQYGQNKPGSINRHRFRVLVGGLVYCATYMGKLWFDPELYLRDVLSVLAKYKGAEITVRYREAGPYQYFKWMYERYFAQEGSRVEFQHGAHTRFQDELAKFDIYIGCDSGTVLEAVLAGKYVVSYQSATQRIDPPFDGSSELMVARTPEELTAHMEAILGGAPYTRAMNEVTSLERVFGPLNDINERIYSVLQRILAERVRQAPFVDVFKQDSEKAEEPRLAHSDYCG